MRGGDGDCDCDCGGCCDCRDAYVIASLLRYEMWMEDCTDTEKRGVVGGRYQQRKPGWSWEGTLGEYILDKLLIYLHTPEVHDHGSACTCRHYILLSTAGGAGKVGCPTTPRYREGSYRFWGRRYPHLLGERGQVSIDRGLESWEAGIEYRDNRTIWRSKWFLGYVPARTPL